MEITLIQALLIGLWTAVSYAGMLLGIYTNRALFLAFGVGVILGDIPTALAVGAISELAFMGFGVGAGGTVPPNPIGPGIIGTLLAITIPDVTPEVALSLSIPFAVAIQFLQTAVYTFASGTPAMANRALDERNFGKYKVTINLTIVLFLIVGFLLGFLGAYSMEFLSTLVEMVPESLLAGLNVAGGMLPAIGFAMILSVMISKELVPFAILGYVLAAFFELPVMGIALFATVFALKAYNEYENKGQLVTAEGEEEDDEDWI